MSAQPQQYSYGPVGNPFAESTERPPKRPTMVTRATIHDPTPGYAHTMQVDGFDRVSEAREALAVYAEALVHLNLTPDWGVRMIRHRISKRRVAWYVMLDGPDPGPPALLAARVHGGGGGGSR